MTKRCKRLYSVYDNRTDFPIAIYVTADAAAKAMGITLQSFYSAVYQTRVGKWKRWTILVHDDSELEEHDV